MDVLNIIEEKKKGKDILFFCLESQNFIGISEKDISDWSLIYPAVDIQKQLAQMKQWILSNLSKSKKPIRKKFITNWLEKTNESNIYKSAYNQHRESNISSSWWIDTQKTKTEQQMKKAE